MWRSSVFSRARCSDDSPRFAGRPSASEMRGSAGAGASLSMIGRARPAPRGGNCGPKRPSSATPPRAKTIIW